MSKEEFVELTVKIPKAMADHIQMAPAFQYAQPSSMDTTHPRIVPP